MVFIIPLKAPLKVDIKKPLVDWLDEPPDYEAFANPLAFVCVKPSFTSADCLKEITRLASLRNCLADAITKSSSHRHALDEFALQDSHEYHAALMAFQQHAFPTWDEASPLTLTWKAAVGPQQESHGSLIWDQVCTLWNIAALESFLASETKDRKMAVKHYQNAASTMTHLLEAIQGQVFETVDMNKNLVIFWERTMLACAQTAAYDMVATPTNGEGEPPKHALLSYLAMGAVPVWNEALVLSKDPMLVSNLPKPMQDWGAKCKYWSMMLTAKAEYHQACVSRLASEYGPELLRLTAALTSFAQCKEFCGTIDSPDEVKQVDGWIALLKDRKAQADKDNLGFMYADANTSAALPPIRPQLIAKSNLPMPETMTVPKVALFLNVRSP